MSNASEALRILVATCSHRGDDARIVHRQSRALIDAGHEVTLIAPDPGPESVRHDPVGLRRIVVRRTAGRRRLRGWIDVWRSLRAHSPTHDVVIIHDPELVAVGLLVPSTRAKRIWDVHEDFVAIAHEAAWIPAFARGLIIAVVKFVIAVSKRFYSVIVAEQSYVNSFPGALLVPNTSEFSSARPQRDVLNQVVYVGRISRDRGIEEMICVGRRLGELEGPRVVLVGPVDADSVEEVTRAAERGDVTWLGPRANPEALDIVSQSLLGLCLLRDTSNYRGSYPTKIGEYFTVGVPVIATPLPVARDVISRSGGGVVTTSWGGDDLVSEVVESILDLISDRDGLGVMGDRAWEFANENLNWMKDKGRFVSFVESVAQD